MDTLKETYNITGRGKHERLRDRAALDAKSRSVGAHGR